jgi:hypothetical protein
MFKLFRNKIAADRAVMMKDLFENKIHTAADRAKLHGYTSSRQMLFKLAKGFKWNGRVEGQPVFARISAGEWVADCDCDDVAAQGRNVSFVDPNDPVFVCPVCGNAGFGGALRPVIFPENRGAIEAELLKRPFAETTLRPVAGPRPAVKRLLGGAVRNWSPGETIKQLEAERIAAEKDAKSPHRNR